MKQVSLFPVHALPAAADAKKRLIHLALLFLAVFVLLPTAAQAQYCYSPTNPNPSVTICSPGSTATSPVHVIAGTTDSNPVQVIKMYVDGVLIYKGYTNELDYSVGMSNGTHKIQVTAKDSIGQIFSSSLSVLVGSSTTTTSSAVSIAVSPTSASILTGATQQFTAAVSGTTNTAVTWSANGGSISSSGVFSASTAGTYTVTATSAADPTKSASASVKVSNPVSVSISPASVALTTGQTQQFTAAVSGTTNTGVTWSATGGSITSAGVFSSATAGTYNVTATSVADPTKSATAPVQVSAPSATVAVSVSPTSATLTTGQTQQFTASVSGTTNTAVTWTADGGAITSAGVFSSSTAGTYHVTATSAADPTKSATATVQVNAPAATVAVSVSPTTASTTTSGTQQFLASVTGTTNTSVTWTSSGGTITSAGVFSSLNTGTFTVTATSVADPTKSASASISVTQPVTSTSGYGNVGDPYNGAGPDPNAKLISACTTLNSGGSYRLSQNIGSSLGTTCIGLNAPNVKLDLGGFTITGRIVAQYAVLPSGFTLFNGTINCDKDASTQDQGCVNIQESSSAMAAPMTIHHLTLHNSNLTGSDLRVDWDLTGQLAGDSFYVYNITSSAPVGGGTNTRTDLLSVTGANQTVEYANNNLYCPNTRACEAMICYRNASCKVHDNLFQIDMNTWDETSRALLIDGFTQSGEVWNNVFTVNNNRAVRIRDSSNIRVHDNVVHNIVNAGGSYVAAVHLADPDAPGYDDLHVTVDHNTFEVDSGTVFMVRDGKDLFVNNNTINCIGSCSGRLGQIRSQNSTPTVVDIESDPTATVLPAAQTTLEPNTQATICKAGTASGGSVTYTTTCQ